MKIKLVSVIKKTIAMPLLDPFFAHCAVIGYPELCRILNMYLGDVSPPYFTATFSEP